MSGIGTLLMTLVFVVLWDPNTEGYSRDKFPHWRQTGPDCNVRDQILERDGQSIKKKGCNVVDGVWYSWYDGRTMIRTFDVDIDHVVPLAEAWRSGADEWSPSKREEFANDPENLQASSKSSNRAKGDQGIDEWLPRERSCEYVVQYKNIKLKYGLEIQEEELNVRPC